MPPCRLVPGATATKAKAKCENGSLRIALSKRGDRRRGVSGHPLDRAERDVVGVRERVVASSDPGGPAEVVDRHSVVTMLGEPER